MVAAYAPLPDASIAEMPDEIQILRIAGRQAFEGFMEDIDPGRNIMCRNIKTLFNFEPPATEAEIKASAIQFVRKLSGFSKPSDANEAAFNLAVEQVHTAARSLVQSLVTNAPARNREIEIGKLRETSRKRFGPEVKFRTLEN